MSQLESLEFKTEAAERRMGLIMILQSLGAGLVMNRAERSHLLPCARPMHLSCLLLPCHHVRSPGRWDLICQMQLVVECCDLIEDQRRDLCSLFELLKLFCNPLFWGIFCKHF